LTVKGIGGWKKRKSRIEEQDSSRCAIGLDKETDRNSDRRREGETDLV
jgi:hypothetical protein